MPWAQPHAGVAEGAQLHVLERHLGASEGDPFSGFLLGHVRTLSCAAQQLLPCCRVRACACAVGKHTPVVGALLHR